MTRITNLLRAAFRGATTSPILRLEEHCPPSPASFKSADSIPTLASSTEDRLLDLSQAVFRDIELVHQIHSLLRSSQAAGTQIIDAQFDYGIVEEGLLASLRSHRTKDNPSRRANVWSRLALNYLCQKKFDDAEHYLRRASQLHSDIGEHTEAANTQRRLGDLRLHLGYFLKSKASFSHAIKLYRRAHDQFEEGNANAKLTLVCIALYNFAGNCDNLAKAETYIYSALALHRGFTGTHFHQRTDYLLLTQIYFLQGRIPEAEKVVHHALAMVIPTDAGTDSDIVIYRSGEALAKVFLAAIWLCENSHHVQEIGALTEKAQELFRQTDDANGHRLATLLQDRIIVRRSDAGVASES